MFCPQRQPDLRPCACRAERFFAQLRANDRAERHARKMRRTCQLRQRAKKLSYGKRRIFPVLRVGRVRGSPLKPKRHAARRAGKRAGSGINLALRKAREVVRAVNFRDAFFFEQLTAGRRARAGLFGGLEQKEHVPAHDFSFQHQAYCTETRRVSVVPAKMCRAAV